MSGLLSDAERTPDFLLSSKRLSDFLAFQSRPKKKRAQKSHAFTVRSITIAEERYRGQLNSPNGLAGSPDKYSLYDDQSIEYYSMGQARATPNSRRKTKIVCTIGPSTSTREMIWKLAETGMNVAHLNMSHGDHSSHQKTIDLVKEYNSQFDDKVVAIMLDTKGPEFRSGDLPQPIMLEEGQEFNFTIKRGVSTENTVA
ncbi:pyruvate kinase isozyme G, chloroplastic-like [Humulus lupulus]|uniref:pyruvate kinase isozyme G, chloroplastic-like n=1 Tax=Humulus lupulus TaxID=3486 RepID=UPI002B416372|nr:pyruvate kinase isozyme G, chloroplastic-like [Humulus lupulus]